ncbi:MAG: PrsW family glutamic-type intramembrane protease [Candidatus Gracilibacteria bacterium]|nr:PrsW family glutamic-type intramembrane protease [Candidatus Gracilibacteria bacterium]
MVSDIFRIFFIGIFCLFPILIWGYIFSYIDNSDFHSRRFVSGIIAGAFSVVPVLYLENILRFFGLNDINIFSLVSTGSGFFLIFSSIFAISMIIAILLFFMTLFFINDFANLIKIYYRNILSLLLYSALFGFVYMIARNIPFLDFEIKNPVSIGSNIFNTFFLILIYYMIIGFIEEISKHFSFLPSSLSEINSAKSGVLLAIFIALGFGFIENILYINNIYLDKGGLSGDIFSTWIFRGIFSLFVHVLCSVIVGSYFSKAYLFYSDSMIRYIRVFLSGIIISVIIHAIFDISLTLSFTAIIFIYLMFGYLYVTKIFYKEN